MSCNYFIHNHLIGDEIALSQFLLGKYKYLDKLGDTVFSTNMSEAQAKANSQILDMQNAVKGVKAAKSKLAMVSIEEDGETIDDLEGAIDLNKKYVGVTKFIKNFRHMVNGKMEPILPILDLEEYFAKRRKAWKSGNFTDKEIALLLNNGSSLETVQQMSEEAKRELTNNPEAREESKFKNYENQIRYQWEVQARFGNVFHKAMEMLMSNNIAGINDNTVPGWSYFPNEVRSSIINYANNLKTYIQNTYGGTIYTEQALIAKNPLSNQGLYGIIDLLVIDKDGNAHIFDYKTSTNERYGSVKKQSIIYQLRLYARMLSQYGFKDVNITTNYIPVTFKNFAKAIDRNDNIQTELIDDTESKEYWTETTNGKYLRDKYTLGNIDFNGWAPGKDIASTIIKIVENPATKTSENLDEILPFKELPVALSGEDVITSVNDSMSKLFAHNKNDKKTDEELRKEIEESGGFKPTLDGKLVFTTTTGNEIEINIENHDVAKAEAEMFTKVKESYEQLDKFQEELFIGTKEYIQYLLTGKVTHESDLFMQKHRRVRSKTGDSGWTLDYLEKYKNHAKDFSLIESEVLDAFHMIALKNNLTGNVDILRVSSSNLKGRGLWKNGNSKLSANLVDDSTYDTEKGQLMLQGKWGNIEAIESMLVLNGLAAQLVQHQVNKINKIQVLNPYQQEGLPASNDELRYSFSELLSQAKLEIKNEFDQSAGHIALASNLDLLEDEFANVMSESNEVLTNSGWGWLRQDLDKTEADSISNQLDGIMRYKETRAEKINKLIDYITKKYEKAINFSSDTQGLVNEQRSPLFNLYYALHMALAEVRGIKLLQQTQAYSKFIDTPMSIRSGLSGMYTDNPGNLKSATLNLVTKAVSGANQNVRDAVMRDYGKIQQLVQALKDDYGMGYFSERFLSDNSDLYTQKIKGDDGKIHYDGMIYRDSVTGDLLFTNPWADDARSKNLTDAQRKFLEFYLKKQNALRFGADPEYSEEVMTISNDPRYFQVPLIKKTSTRVTPNSVLSGAKSVFDGLIHFKQTATSLGNTVDNLLNATSGKNTNTISHHSDADSFYEMSNKMERSFDSKFRSELLQKDDTYFEDNLETLLLNLETASYTQKEVNAVMPIIKASVMHLLMQGANQNTKYTNEVEYLNDYITNKVKNESLIPEEEKQAAKVLSKFRQAASFCMLAFAPVQYGYQLVDGIWKGVMLMVRGDAPFTFQELMAAGKLVYQDLWHYGNKHSKLELLNTLMGLSDMDMNTYTQKIKSEQVTFTNLAYRCASRPDYYNRLILLTAQMLHDGTWDAYSVDSEGNLKYDWKQDKRFAAFAVDPKGINKTPEWKTAQGRYIAAMRQFVKEGVRNGEGELVKLDLTNPQPIPRAYTNLEIMSIKSLGDTLYGYYSHETKSMIQSMTIGALWMQYRTYWSGKKNQYLAHGSIKLQGSYVIKEGVYEKIDPITGEVTLTSENTGIPHYVWQGNWQEGILVSLANVSEMFRTKGFKETIKFLHSNDPKAKIYTSNLRQGIYDLIMFAVVGSLVGRVVGGWVEDEKKKAKEDNNFTAALKANGASVLAKILTNSFLDLNMIESIGGPVGDWTPVSLNWAGRSLKTLYSEAVGDHEFENVLTKTFGAARQNQILLNFYADQFHAEE